MLTILALVVLAPSDYTIVEIHREARFAGKLGELVHESLVLEHDGKRVTVDVRGDYHTMCVRPWQRLQEGQTIRINRALGDRVNRADIART